MFVKHTNGGNKKVNMAELLSTRLHAVQENKSNKGKKYTYYRLAKDTGINYGYVYRVMHGQANPSREILTKICQALECSSQEQADIFHAAGYLSPKEIEEEKRFAA